MAFLVTTIIVEVDDNLVKDLPAAQENLEHFTEATIRNRLFGEGYMPDDVEIDSWSVSSKWVLADGQPFSLVLPRFDGDVLKEVNEDVLDFVCGNGDYPDDKDDALRRVVDTIKESK